MKKALLIKVDGTKEIVVAPKAEFTLEELYAMVGSPITQVPLPSGRYVIANDNGKLDGLEINEEASRIWREEYPIEKYPENNDGVLVGNILIGGRGIDKLL